MKHAVWKYQLRVCDDVQVLSMPFRAEFLTLQMQGEVLTLWFKVDTSITAMTSKGYRVVGTGHEHDWLGSAKYVGTGQQMGGQLVWHVFEVPR